MGRWTVKMKTQVGSIVYVWKWRIGQFEEHRSRIKAAAIRSDREDPSRRRQLQRRGWWACEGVVEGGLRLDSAAGPLGHVEDRETRHFIRRLPISPAPSKISHSQTPRALDGLQTYLLLPCPYLCRRGITNEMCSSVSVFRLFKISQRTLFSIASIADRKLRWFPPKGSPWSEELIRLRTKQLQSSVMWCLDCSCFVATIIRLVIFSITIEKSWW